MRKTSPTPAVLLRILLGGFLLWVALASFGIFFHLPSPGNDSVAHLRDGSYRVTGTIVDIGHSEERQQITLSDLEVNNQPLQDRVIAFAPTFPPREYGDQVTVRCSLQTPEPFEGFAYDRFLAAKEVYKTCFTHSAPLFLSAENGEPIKQFLWPLSQRIVEQIDRTFGEPHGSLLAGLLLGEQRFTEEWEARFIATGTSHVVAASGYNVTIVVFLLFGFLTSVGVKRQQAFYLLLAGIAAYVVVAGGDAAVMRAGVMGSIVLLARQLGRRASMLNVLLLTASAMLLINPFLLRDDVGFQLSMLSTIALIYFSPVLDRKFVFIPSAYGIRESLSATLAATIFSLPVIFLSFGTLSVVGPVANLFILPLIPYAMLFGSIAILMSFVSGTIGVIISGPAWALLSAVLLVIKSLSELPIVSVVLPESIQIPAAVGSIILLVILWHQFLRKKQKR